MVTSAAKSAVGSAVPVTDVWQVVLGLVLVIATIVLVAWLMRKMQTGTIGAGASMRVLAAMSVGPRERVMLVDVAGTQILLGVTTAQISALHTFADPVVLPLRPPVSEFGARLRQAIGVGTAP